MTSQRGPAQAVSKAALSPEFRHQKGENAYFFFSPSLSQGTESGCHCRKCVQTLTLQLRFPQGVEGSQGRLWAHSASPLQSLPADQAYTKSTGLSNGVLGY